ncbi:hypothetical protein JZ751_005312 [Albula glossodonta]|uniref:Tenascin C n=1 Tax=Albula glossodonta TaxID=121402 RepID=A0A8T2N7L8_9TELE|nr:hypothetical protein JZ751_005312 [Albula glossodonta]
MHTEFGCTNGLSAPHGIGFSDVTDTSATVLWAIPRTRVDSYRITYVPVEGGAPATVTVDGSQTQAVLAGLNPGATYQVTVIAVKGLEESEPGSGSVTTGLDKPRGLTANNVTETEAVLNWEPSIAVVDGYVITYSADTVPPVTEYVIGDTVEFGMGSLLPDTLYTVAVHAVRETEKSGDATTEFKTALGAPFGISFTDVTDTSATVQWAKPPTSVESYKVTFTPTEGGTPATVTVDGSLTEAVLTGLTPGAEYQVTVIAVKGAEESEPGSGSVTTGLDKPRNLKTINISETEAVLVWEPSIASVDGYVINYSAETVPPVTASVSGSTVEFVMSSLLPDTVYAVTIHGVREAEKSGEATTEFKTSLSTPTGISFSDVTDTSATVNWAAPTTSVDSFMVTYVLAAGGTPATVTVDGSLTQAVLTGLTPGAEYQVTVIAVKGAEESKPGSGSVTTGLDTPTGLKAINVTDTEALLLWKPSIATVDGYVITYSADTVSPVTERVSGNIVEFEMGSLAPLTQYTVTVHAVREAEKSGAATTDFTTDVDPPRDLAAGNILMESAVLTWMAPSAAITGYALNIESADGVIRELILGPTDTSHSLSGLTHSTEYKVKLYAIAGEKKSRIVTGVFTTIDLLYKHPKDCGEALLNGEKTSGLYTIYIGGAESQPLQVYCDMTTDGGGWIVFLRRQNGKLEFFRNWKNYTAGFGNMNDEFWLGLGNLHKISTAGQYELRVDLRDKGEEAYAQYDKFLVTEPRSRYKMHLGSYSGTAGDSMTYHQGRPFSTYDHDNDIAVTNCALSYKGAFWYKNCHRVNLMGRYGDNSHSKGVNWFHWKGHEHSIEFAEMKMRPTNLRNLERRKRS